MTGRLEHCNIAHMWFTKPVKKQQKVVSPNHTALDYKDKVSENKNITSLPLPSSTTPCSTKAHAHLPPSAESDKVCTNTQPPKRQTTTNIASVNVTLTLCRPMSSKCKPKSVHHSQNKPTKLVCESSGENTIMGTKYLKNLSIHLKKKT